MPGHRKKIILAGGVTLPEVLVGSALSLVILGLLVALFVPIKVACITGDNKAEVNMNAFRSLAVLKNELHDSSSVSVTYDLAVTPSSPAALSFMTAYDQYGTFVTGADGKPLWQGYTIYYLPSGTDKLLKKKIPVTPTTTPKRLSLNELKVHCDGKGMTASFDVHSFKIGPPLVYKDFIDISIETRLVYSNRSSSIVPETRIFPEN